MASESLASRTLKSLLRDDDGYVAVVAALAMTVLILTASLALDFGRFSYLRRDLGVALDSAAIAVARRARDAERSLEVTPAAEPDMRRTALAHLRTNYPSLDIADGDLTLSNPPHPSNPSARDGERLEVCAMLKESLMFRNAPADLSACSEVTAFGLDVLEIAFALDMSLSMSGSKLLDLKRALVGEHGRQGFLDRIPPALWDARTVVDGRRVDAVRVALVPFAGGVRLPPRADRSFAVVDAPDVIGGSESWIAENSPLFNVKDWIDRGQGGRLAKYHLSPPNNSGDYSAEAIRLHFPFTDARGTSDPADDAEVSHRLGLYEHLGVGWNGCVEARPYPDDVSDSPPDPRRADSLWVPWFEPDEPDLNVNDDSVYDDALWDANFLGVPSGKATLRDLGFFAFHHHDPDGDGIATLDGDLDHIGSSGGLACRALAIGSLNAPRFLNSYLFDTGGWVGNLSTFRESPPGSGIHRVGDDVGFGPARRILRDNRFFNCPAEESVVYNPSGRFAGSPPPSDELVRRALRARMGDMRKYTPENWSAHTLRSRCFCGHGEENVGLYDSAVPAIEPGYFGAIRPLQRLYVDRVRPPGLHNASAHQNNYYHVAVPVGGRVNDGRSCVRVRTAFDAPLDVACRVGGIAGAARPFIGVNALPPTDTEIRETVGALLAYLRPAADGLFFGSEYPDIAHSMNEILLAVRAMIGVLIASGAARGEACEMIADAKGSDLRQRRGWAYGHVDGLNGYRWGEKDSSRRENYAPERVAACRKGRDDDDRNQFLSSTMTGRPSAVRGCRVDVAALRNHFTASVRGDPTRLREWTAAAWGEQAYEVGIDGIGPGPPLSPRASSAGEILDAYERLADVLNGRRYCDLIVREAGGHEPLAANYPSHPYRSCMIPPLRPLSGDKDAIKATLGVSTAGRFFRGDDQMRPKGRAYTVIPQGIAWGWRMLSPSPPFSEGVAYGPNRIKILVLLSDGANEIPSRQGGGATLAAHTAYGDWKFDGRFADGNFAPDLDAERRGVYEKAADDAGVSGIEKEAYVALSLRTEEACRNVKGAARAAGASVDDSIRIFAVAFGFRDEAPMDVASKEMLRRCASTPDSLSPRYFFDAADRDGLEAALQAVLDSLGDGLFISR